MQITGFPLFFLRAIKLTAACLVAALVAISHSTLAAQLSGQVLDPQGAAVVSAMVTLQHKKLNKTRTTYSAADGTYRLGITDDGLYDLRVRRIGFGESTESALPVVADSHLHRDIVLKPLAKEYWVHQLPASDWFARVEFSSSALRGQFSIQCAMCHQQGASTTRLSRSEQDWQDNFDLMAEFGAVMTRQLYDEAPAALNAAFDMAHLDLDSFPDHPPVLDANVGPVEITEWEVGVPTSFLHDMVVGGEGIIYTVDWIGDKLFALDPVTNEIKEWDIPSGDLGPGGILGILAERGRRYLHHTPKVAPHSLQVSPGGDIWITLSTGRGLSRFDPKTETFKNYDHPDKAKYPHTLRFDHEGNIWYTVSMTNHLAKFDVAKEQFTVYDLPTRNWTQWFLARAMGAMVWVSNTFDVKGQSVVADPEMTPVPYGIDVTPDGKVWFSQFNNRNIGFIEPSTEKITMIETPFVGPRRLRSDSKGVLWIPAYNEGRFYRYDPAVGEFKEYRLPTGNGDLAYALAIDPRDDSVWLCGTNSDSIIHFQPTTESFKTYQLPTRVSFTRELEVDKQGNVWTSISNMPFYQIEGGHGKLVRLSFPQQVNAKPLTGKLQ